MHRADTVDLDLVSNLYIFRTTSRRMHNVIHPVLCCISMAMETHQASLCMHALDETKN